MSRGPRRCSPSSYQHVISRFVDRRFHFGDDADRHKYLDLLTLTQKATAFDWLSFSFALMSSHVHLGLFSGQQALAALFHPLHTRFARYWHKRYGGLGPIFADRPANFEMPPELVPRMIAYHHRNPVTAGVVAVPAESRWTSHRAYLRLDPGPPWLDIERGLALCGFADTSSGRHAFDEFVREIDLHEPLSFARADPLQRDDMRTDRPSAPPEFGSREWALLRRLVLQELGDAVDTHFQDRGRRGAASRRLFAMVARWLHRPFVSIAEQLGVSPGAVHHLLNRRSELIEPLEAQARRIASQWRDLNNEEQPSSADCPKEPAERGTS